MLYICLLFKIVDAITKKKTIFLKFLYKQLINIKRNLSKYCANNILTTNNIIIQLFL